MDITFATPPNTFNTGGKNLIIAKPSPNPKTHSNNINIVLNNLSSIILFSFNYYFTLNTISFFDLTNLPSIIELSLIPFKIISATGSSTYL